MNRRVCRAKKGTRVVQSYLLASWWYMYGDGKGFMNKKSIWYIGLIVVRARSSFHSLITRPDLRKTTYTFVGNLHSQLAVSVFN